MRECRLNIVLAICCSASSGLRFVVKSIVLVMIHIIEANQGPVHSLEIEELDLADVILCDHLRESFHNQVEINSHRLLMLLHD
jgi:hypothetical protein